LPLLFFVLLLKSNPNQPNPIPFNPIPKVLTPDSDLADHLGGFSTTFIDTPQLNYALNWKKSDITDIDAKMGAPPTLNMMEVGSTSRLTSQFNFTPQLYLSTLLLLIHPFNSPPHLTSHPLHFSRDFSGEFHPQHVGTQVPA
jgi:hypothetical protein